MTNNSPSGVDVAGQLVADVAASGAGARFTFRNVGAVASRIDTIGFDDRADHFTGLDVAPEPAGVDFAEGGGNNLSPLGSPGFVPEFAANRAGGAANGIDASPGGTESLGLLLTLASGRTFAHVRDALVGGQLRLALHVISIGAAEKSDKFLNRAPVLPRLQSVPEPALYAHLLSGACLLGLAGLRRRLVRDPS
jgi:hypothetical protein